MKNRLLFILLVLFSSSSFGQQNVRFSFQGVYFGHFQLSSKQTELRRAFLEIEFIDSVYLMNLFVEKIDNSMDRSQYMGFYSIDSTGHVVLKGEHPLEKSTFTIEKQPTTATDKDEQRTGHLLEFDLTFTVKLKEEILNKKGLKAEMKSRKSNFRATPDVFQNYNTILPKFYSDFRRVFRDKTVRDSIYKAIAKNYGVSCGSAYYPSKKATVDCKNEPDYFFKVDSVRFDTIYINKLLVERKCVSSSSRDTICLNETVKIQINSKTIHAYFDGIVHSGPSYPSEIIYFKEEVDDITNLVIKDYAKDAFGFEWIKVEMDVIVYNFNRKEGEDPQVNKKITGWVMQKSLHIS